MNYVLPLIFFLFISNCSLNKDSQYWTEEAVINKDIEEKLSKILKKAGDIRNMSPEEYEIYIDAYSKKSKYPDISK